MSQCAFWSAINGFILTIFVLVISKENVFFFFSFFTFFVFVSACNGCFSTRYATSYRVEKRPFLPLRADTQCYLVQGRTLLIGALYKSMYDSPPDMVSAMKEIVVKEPALCSESRNLLSVAYKNVIGARRASWRIIKSIESNQEDGSAKQTQAKKYREQASTLFGLFVCFIVCLFVFVLGCLFVCLFYCFHAYIPAFSLNSGPLDKWLFKHQRTVRITS